jgi:arabinose-5-phosphate isomerase
MAIGDGLAAVWMQRRGISAQDFALNHPAGALGRQLTLTAADLMLPVQRWPPLAAMAPLPEVLAGLTAAGVGAAWVADPQRPGRLQGLITDGDLRRTLQQKQAHQWAGLTASQLMTADPITVQPQLLAVAAMELMERNRRKAIAVLPVQAEDGELLGLLRLHDLVQAGFS